MNKKFQVRIRDRMYERFKRELQALKLPNEIYQSIIKIFCDVTGY